VVRDVEKERGSGKGWGFPKKEKEKTRAGTWYLLTPLPENSLGENRQDQKRPLTEARTGQESSLVKLSPEREKEGGKVLKKSERQNRTGKIQAAGKEDLSDFSRRSSGIRGGIEQGVKGEK